MTFDGSISINYFYAYDKLDSLFTSVTNRSSAGVPELGMIEARIQAVLFQKLVVSRMV